MQINYCYCYHKDQHFFGAKQSQPWPQSTTWLILSINAHIWRFLQHPGTKTNLFLERSALQERK